MSKVLQKKLVKKDQKLQQSFINLIDKIKQVFIIIKHNATN